MTEMYPPYAPPVPEKQYKSVGIIVAVTVIVLLLLVVIVGGYALLSDIPKDADLSVVGFNYEYDWWTDTIHVWGTVVNNGDGSTHEWRSITVHVTVWFQGQPYEHEAWLSDTLGPGESCFWERTWDVPFTLDLDPSVRAECTKVEWYNA